MSPSQPSRHTAHDGQILILFAASLLLMLAILALAVDVGFLLAQRRGVQNAADAAALAVAHAVQTGETDQATLENIARYYAEQNGYEVTPTITYEPSQKKVSVDLEYDVPKFFVGLLYPGPWRVPAHAAAATEPEVVDVALLALNPEGLGIETSGNTTITVAGGSVMSNNQIVTRGSTTITADQYVNARNGFRESGNSTLQGGLGTNPFAPEVPDPLADKIQPPPLPAFPTEALPSPGGSAQECKLYPGWSDPVFTIPAGLYSGGGAACIDINSVPSGQTLRFAAGNYRFTNGAGIRAGGGSSGTIVMQQGNYTFDGGEGITIDGSTPNFHMEEGTYAFRNGARLSVSGGANTLTLNGGTFIFDGGAGLVFGGSGKLHFNPGQYTFYFRNGANLLFSGNTPITFGEGVYVKMYFYNGSSLRMEGSTTFDIPSGEYYFTDRPKNAECGFKATGNSNIHGKNVFLYFGPGCRLFTNGSAQFGFTAPKTNIYPGYHPGVFMYAHPDNHETFQWNGSTSLSSEGVIYLPSATLTTAGQSFDKVFKGQVIVDSYTTGGGNGLSLEYEHYVDVELPRIYLVE